MACDRNGCDMHDYRVSSLWCAYQFEMERDGRRIRALETNNTLQEAENINHLNDNEVTQEYPKRKTVISKPRDEVKIKWNL
jgi:hypothetical protein